MKFLVILMSFVVSGLSTAFADEVEALTVDEQNELGQSFYDCHQAYRRSEDSEPARPSNCRELAQQAAIVARFCDSDLGRRRPGGIYETNSDFCYKATEFRGYIISRSYEAGDWRQSVRDSVEDIRTGAFDRLRSIPFVGRLLSLGCEYNYEDNIATVPEGVRLPYGTRQRDVPGITANCEF